MEASRPLHGKNCELLSTWMFAFDKLGKFASGA